MNSPIDILDEFKNIEWKIHHAYGQSYITPKEYNKWSDLLSSYRRRKEVNNRERELINTLLKSGLRHYYELKEYLYNAPRRDAQKFIGKKKIREFIFKRDNYTCLCCGSKYSLSIDHIVPVNKNGLNRLGNLQTLCTPCNSRKSDKIIDYRS